MLVPHIEKIVLNMGLGDAKVNKKFFKTGTRRVVNNIRTKSCDYSCKESDIKF